MPKKLKEPLDVDVADFDTDTALINISKSDLYVSVSLTPEELEHIALTFLDIKTRIEILREKK